MSILSNIYGIIEMAREDRTTFEAIEFQFIQKEQDYIELMRSKMKLSSFKLWISRVQEKNNNYI